MYNFCCSTNHCTDISFLEPLAFRKTAAELLLYLKFSLKLLKEPPALLYLLNHYSSFNAISDVYLTVIHLCALCFILDVLFAPGPPAVQLQLQLSLLNPRTGLLMAQKAWRQTMVWNAQLLQCREPD